MKKKNKGASVHVCSSFNTQQCPDWLKVVIFLSCFRLNVPLSFEVACLCSTAFVELGVCVRLVGWMLYLLTGFARWQV